MEGKGRSLPFLSPPAGNERDLLPSAVNLLILYEHCPMPIAIDAMDLKRDLDHLSLRLGKTQDYL